MPVIIYTTETEKKLKLVCPELNNNWNRTFNEVKYVSEWPPALCHTVIDPVLLHVKIVKSTRLSKGSNRNSTFKTAVKHNIKD